MSELIQVVVADQIQHITINRADKKNALNLAMYRALTAAVQTADADKTIRVSVLTGTDEVFCSGNDIEDFLQNPPAGDASPVLQFVHSIVNAKKPIIAAVNGIAVGVGVTMLLHCDLVYASEQASMQLPFASLGLCPEAGSSLLLPLLMGQQKAAELVLLGEMFTADDAANAGIVNSVFAHEQLLQTTLKTAAKLAAQPPNATRVTKKLLRAATQDMLQAAISRENKDFIAMLSGAEANEALTAFMQKRKPDFSQF